MTLLKKSAFALGLSTTALVGMANADQVILDDLIVTQSLCVGQDCSNGESFGFDTIRLKENNVRIKFDDTSNSASFPNRDWQLTANDSTNGGANKFSIEDITGGRVPFTIEAAAPSNSLYVDDGGRVGFGTATPIVELHSANGDTPTLRLEQNGSSGFTPQTWDVAGNETNFFVRDVTSGSDLVLRLRAGAPANSIFVQTTGDIGLGTESPGATLHVVGESILLEETDSNVAPTSAFHIRENGSANISLEDTSVTAGDNTGREWKVKNTTGKFLLTTNDTTATKEFELDQNGNLLIAGTLTTGSATVYPDYVFEADYELMPLGELNQFIAENGHLPRIPNAAHAAENGINITNLQLSLLEKVEELTLYTLQQEARIAELEAAQKTK